MTDRVRLKEELAGVLRQAGLLQGDAIGPAYYEDISHVRSGRPWLVLRPASTAEVASCLLICHRHGQPLVPQGGLTGLVSRTNARQADQLRAFGRGAARRPLVHAATLRDALADLTPGDVKVLITKGGVPRTNEPDRVLLQGLCCSSSSTAAALHIPFSTGISPRNRGSLYAIDSPHAEPSEP